MEAQKRSGRLVGEGSEGAPVRRMTVAFADIRVEACEKLGRSLTTVMVKSFWLKFNYC